MSRSLKHSHRIIVNDVEYRWRATGNDGWISVTIWPSNGVGPAIACQFRYHETFNATGPGHWVSSGNQIVVTNKLVRRVILYSIDAESYVPTKAGTQLNIRNIEDKIEWADSVRATHGGSKETSGANPM